MRTILLPLLLGIVMTPATPAAKKADKPDSPPPAKPKIAFFPLGGTAKEDLRDKCGFSLRAKLDRAGPYEVIDGPKMKDVAEQASDPITAATKPDQVKELGKLVDADVLVWGDLTNKPEGAIMKIKVLDLREGPSARPHELSKIIKEPTDLRFVSEEILQTLPGVATFEHPIETAVWNDAAAEKMWQQYPNLVKNGDFSQAGHWKGIYMAEYYDVPISDKLPDIDKVVIYRMPDGKSATNNVLAMNLSRTCAENNGMACLSDSIEVAPGERYRVSFRYKSDGPVLHVFIKGYTMFDNIEGKKVPREIYRRQVPPTGATNGQWVTIVDDLNPQHIAFPVQTLKIDLYAYLTPGVVMFDDVILKPVGKQTRKASDESIKKPIERKSGK
jgi:hypothetical protein